MFRGVLYSGGNSCAVPSRFVPVGGGGLAPPPLTQSGSGAAFEDMAPLDLMAAFFLRGAIVKGGGKVSRKSQFCLLVGVTPKDTLKESFEQISFSLH